MPSRLPTRVALPTLVVVLSACASTPKPTETQTGPEPAAALADLEARLLAATGVSASCTITSTGAVESEVKVVLELGQPGGDRLDVVGRFGGTRRLGRMEQSGSQTTVFLTSSGSEPMARTVDSPPEVRRALVVGLTRMGLLHNVSTLLGGKLPDHSEGGVEEWVTTTNHRWTAGDTLTFDLSVDGAEAATAAITFDSEGWPIRRTQRVAFEEGAMEVEEQCSWTGASNEAL